MNYYHSSVEILATVYSTGITDISTVTLQSPADIQSVLSLTTARITLQPWYLTIRCVMKALTTTSAPQRVVRLHLRTVRFQGFAEFYVPNFFFYAFFSKRISLATVYDCRSLLSIHNKTGRCLTNQTNPLTVESPTVEKSSQPTHAAIHAH